MHSMTGFGRGSAAAQGVTVRCELKSVNHRGLDVRARCDRELVDFEAEAVREVRGHLARGRIDVQLQLERDAGESGVVRFSPQLALRLVDEVTAFAHAHDDVEPRLTAGDLLRRGELFVVHEDVVAADVLRELVNNASRAAALDLVATRAREGQGLAAELERLLARCEQLVQSIAALSGGAPERLREKLQARLADAGAGVLGEERLAQEVAVLADRVDVQEELARLELHLQHFRELAAGPEAMGRKLDFLCQELMREANTVGSKCNEAATAHHVVELKAEIERLREQVQNVE